MRDSCSRDSQQNQLFTLTVGNIVSDLSMDLITPNRLKLGQNNERGPNGCVKITLNLKKILKTNQNIFNAWFEN